VGSYYIVLYDDVDAPLQLTMKIIMGWLLEFMAGVKASFIALVFGVMNIFEWLINGDNY
jgi:Na+/melibiose symporter-like transporter